MTSPDPTPRTDVPGDTVKSPSGAPGGSAAVPPEVAAAPESARFGKFVRTRKLGAGGMGEVWLAWDGALGRWAALKFLKGEDADEIVRFRREAQIAGKLSHPNIAAIHEVGEAGGKHYIAMEYVEGQTLRTFPRDDPRQLASLVRDAARAVHAAHLKGVIHRDLKPDNLMVTAGRPHLYVMDFGLARQVEGASRLSISGMMVGTPSYMPPEQARGEKAGPAADVYSLGATLYELVTGRRVFDGGSVIEIAMRVVDEEPVAPRRIDPKIDAELETIILKCLEKDSARRYATANDLAEDITRWLEGEPISARPASLMYRLRKRLAKRKAVVGVLAGGAVVVAIVLLALVPALRKAKAQALTQLRKRTETALQAALAVRRAGGAPEQMERFAIDTKEACEEAAALMPELAEPHYHLGRMHRARFRFAEALAAQEEALKREPSYARSRYERGILRVRRFTELKIVRDRGAAEMKRLAMEDLKAAGGPMAEGLAAWLGGDTAGALALLERATRDSPDAEETWNWAGFVALEAKDIRTAIDTFTRGIARDKGYMPNYRGRALAWQDEGERLRAAGADPSEAFRTAIADYDAALGMVTVREDMLGGRAGAKVNWAIHVMGGGEDPTSLLNSAIADLDAAIGLNRAWAELFLRRAAARHNLGNWTHLPAAYEAAERDYSAAIGLEPTREDAWIGRGQLRSKLSRTKEALDDFEEALKLDPKKAEAWQRRAEARMNWANHEEAPGDAYLLAERDFAEAERLDPGSAEIRTGTGAQQLNRGFFESTKQRDPVAHYEKAVAAFDRALAVNPRYAPALAYRAQARTNWGVTVRQRGGDPAELYDAAIADYGAALAVDPSRLETWIRRGDLKVNRAIASQRVTDPSAHYRSALEDFAEVSKRNAANAAAAASSANARGAWLDWLKRSGRAEEAQRVYAEFKEWLATAPATAEVRWRAGVCHQVMEAWREAVDAYEAAVRIDASLEPRLRAKIALCREKIR